MGSRRPEDVLPSISTRTRIEILCRRRTGACYAINGRCVGWAGRVLDTHTGKSGTINIGRQRGRENQWENAQP